MKLAIQNLLLCAATLLSPSTAGLAAETFDHACDAPRGRYSPWDRPVSGTTARISGTLELIEPRLSDRWRPIADVYLKNDTDSIGLRFWLTDTADQDIHVSILGTVTGNTQTLVIAPWRGSPIPFTIDVDSRGAVMASALSSSTSLPLKPFAFDRLSLGCSTGRFHFKVTELVTS